MDESDLTQKIGPLPVWAWGTLVVVVAVAGKVVWGKLHPPTATSLSAAANAGTADPSSAADTTADPNDAVSADGTIQDVADTNGFESAADDFLQSDPTNPAFPVGTSVNGNISPITNTQWGELATDTLVGLGDDPSLVASAIANYLAGNSVTTAQSSIINQALTKIGVTPEGAIPVNISDTTAVTTPPPVTTTTTTPPPATVVATQTAPPTPVSSSTVAADKAQLAALDAQLSTFQKNLALFQKELADPTKQDATHKAQNQQYINTAQTDISITQSQIAALALKISNEGG